MSLWLIQTELERDRGRDQEKNGLHYFMFDIHTTTYVGTYNLALYSPGPGPSPVQALSECAIRLESSRHYLFATYSWFGKQNNLMSLRSGMDIFNNNFYGGIL